MNRSLGVAGLVLLLSGCAAAPPGESFDVSVMTLNVENLFDNVDDPGKDDKTYLPIEAKQSAAHIASCNEIEVESWRNQCLYLDWSDTAVERKLELLAATIRQVDGGPDIIAFQEVENAAILERLVNVYLDGLGYRQPILIEGTDERGIDVALLAKYDLVGAPDLHPLLVPEFPERAGDTRGVLQATFDVGGGARLTAFSVHFPAPFHPTGMRVAAYRHLNDLLAALPDDHHAFAAGDFNTTSTEDAREHLLDNYARPHWQLAHDVGCDGCPGTYYYARDDNWSFLDMILFAPARGAETTARIRGESVRIANAFEQQNTEDGRPLRHNSASGVGVSDHWPMLATFQLTRKQ